MTDYWLDNIDRTQASHRSTQEKVAHLSVLETSELEGCINNMYMKRKLEVGIGNNQKCGPVECSLEGADRHLENSQESSAQVNTQQFTQVMGTDDFHENTQLENSPLGGRAEVMSPAQLRKIPWGRLSNTADPTSYIDMLPRSPKLGSNPVNVVKSPLGGSMCTTMGLRVCQGDVFNEYEIGRSVKCDLAVAPWDTSSKEILKDHSLTKRDQMLRNNALLEVRKRCHGMVSNRHFKILFLLASGGITEVYVEDASGNGTLINSMARLRRGERRLLHTGDEICVVNPILVRSCIQQAIQAAVCKNPSDAIEISTIFPPAWKHEVHRLVMANYSFLFVNLHHQHCVPFQNLSSLSVPNLSKTFEQGPPAPLSGINLSPRRISPPTIGSKTTSETEIPPGDHLYFPKNLEWAKDSVPPQLSSSAQKRPRPGGIVNVRNLRCKSVIPTSSPETLRSESNKHVVQKSMTNGRPKAEQPTQQNGARQETQRRFEAHYDLREELGSGMCGQVRRAINRQTGNVVAVKIIKLSKVSFAKAMHKQRRTHTSKACQSAEDMNLFLLPQDIKAEAIILKSLSHPYIVKLYDVFVNLDSKCVYLVMELVKGGDLFDRIVSQPEGHFDETSARRIMRRLLAPVVYLHSRGIVHRDLKPENILCMSTDLNSNCGFKITDFGLAKQLTDDGLKTFCGTPQYFAPEVLSRRDTVMGRGRYGKEADCWSLGVILYILLSGLPPFDYETAGDSFPTKARKDQWHVDFSDKPWKNVSSGAKELVSLLLERNPTIRLSARAACSHPWILIDDGDTHTNPLDDPLVSSCDAK